MSDVSNEDLQSVFEDGVLSTKGGHEVSAAKVKAVLQALGELCKAPEKLALMQLKTTVDTEAGERFISDELRGKLGMYYNAFVTNEDDQSLSEDACEIMRDVFDRFAGSVRSWLQASHYEAQFQERAESKGYNAVFGKFYDGFNLEPKA